jgi:hypothetical protein
MPYVFGYGSLVDRESLQATLGRQLDPDDGPHPARLSGFRRRWNVAAHSSLRPEYALTGPDGAPWSGWIVFLGIEASQHEDVLGAVCRLADAELTPLDSRERSYQRVSVADRLQRVDGRPIGPPGRLNEPVYTYLPTRESVRRSREAGARGTVMARYLRLVDRAYRSLGEELYAEHLRTFPDVSGVTVDEIMVQPRDPRIRNEAVDPGPAPGLTSA